MRDVFAAIYRNHSWGGLSRSGVGSEPERIREYTDLIAEFIRREGVRSVVDIGCGDWAFSRTIDWSGVDYTGIEIVPELVDQLNRTFASDTVRFICADVLSCDPPAADLCLIKDVFQHWSNAHVQTVLGKLARFKSAIITNDIKVQRRGGWRELWRKTEVGQANCDIPDGGHRPLKLTEPPFALPARRLAIIPVPYQCWINTKEVLLWQR